MRCATPIETSAAAPLSVNVPGSTLAWDLPLGGLWIGLPLGLAAIVLGVNARRTLHGERGSGMALAAFIIAGLALGQMVVYSAALALT